MQNFTFLAEYITILGELGGGVVDRDFFLKL